MPTNPISKLSLTLRICLAAQLLLFTATALADEHPPPLSPAEALKQFKVAEGLAISLVVAEPEVAQPLSISFDDSGRMWVLQYRQYPNPNGLKAVRMDNWLRTKYDKVPDPPPKGPKGKDRISIYEDADGDGRMESVKEFISDLNLASGMAIGHGGVFVVQPPYLLFYADRDKDDVPDGDPEVLLTGFGMEDAHAFANSLTWGPDGWLYGAQGSTATADIRGIGFQQGVWRYHPLTKEFELFSEGGGNAWGIEFDQYGNVFSAGNEVELLVHHVQGAYYVKGFGKHGPLHNPHAYGYFQPVLHHGYVGDSLSGGAVLYQGGAFPERFHNACIAPNTRHSACRWGTVETRTLTFATRAAGDFVTSDDIWFRPVDMTVGPDGAIYIADWYDYNISHSSPKNRSEWYQPSRLDGRVWRVAPPSVAPVASGSFDLSTKSSADLVELLSHTNDWFARQARRLLAERRDRSVIRALTEMALSSPDQRLALQGLWSIHVSGAFDEIIAEKTLASSHEYVRAWTIRLLGDERRVSPALGQKLAALAASDGSNIVRSQLACTAKRLPAADALPIVERLLRRDEDIEDVHIPLLLWWTIEDKAISDTPGVVRLLRSPDAWRAPIVERTISERLARRFAAEGSEAGFAAWPQLLHQAPGESDVELLLGGMLQALAGRKLETTPPTLEEFLAVKTSNSNASAKAIELALRMSAISSDSQAVAAMAGAERTAGERAAIITALGETRTLSAVDPLLSLLGRPEAKELHVAAVAALGYFDDDGIATAILGHFPKLEAAAQARAVEVLCSRPRSALALLEAIDAKAVSPGLVSIDQARRLREMNDERITALVAKHWGRVQASTPLEMLGRVTAVQQMLYRAPGDAASGRAHFLKHCANCHKLHGKGEAVGPDLATAERKNRDALVANVVDPSSVIREQYISHVAQTADGRVVTGLLAESTDSTITILDAKNVRTLLNQADIEELSESPTSLMPEKLLDELTEQQIRDLFAYLQTDVEPP